MVEKPKRAQWGHGSFGAKPDLKSDFKSHMDKDSGQDILKDTGKGDKDGGEEDLVEDFMVPKKKQAVALDCDFDSDTMKAEKLRKFEEFK